MAFFLVLLGPQSLKRKECTLEFLIRALPASPSWLLAGYSLEASSRRLDTLIPAFALGLYLYYFQMFTQLAALLNCLDIIHLDISSAQKQFRWERNWLLRIRAPQN